MSLSLRMMMMTTTMKTMMMMMRMKRMTMMLRTHPITEVRKYYLVSDLATGQGVDHLDAYSEFRPVTGDGECFYRSFIFSYLVLAIPAVPLTMSASLLFGSVTGTIMVSISGTITS